MIRVGCCGFPTKREDYYSKFDIAEVQTTFYNLPRPSTVIRWHSEAPNGFEYAVKAWQTITHRPDSPTYRRTQLDIPESKLNNYGFFRPTDEVREAWKRTKEIVDILKAGMILFQSPPSFVENKETVLNVRKFFEEAERGEFRMLWEPRGKWSEKTVKGLCNDLDIIHCVDPFKDNQLHGEIAYYRLYGIGAYGYKYTDKDLARLLELCPEDKKCYVLFNNISMLDDALRFRFLAKEKK